MRIVEDGNCEECGVPETGKHQLFYCKKFTKEREKQSNITEEIFKAHLKDKTGKMIKEITKFIQKTKIIF